MLQNLNRSNIFANKIKDKMKIIAYCPKSGNIVQKEVLPTELLCLHDSFYTKTKADDRTEELKDIFQFIQKMRYGKVEFSEMINGPIKTLCFNDCEVYNSIGYLELHKENMNIMIDFKHNRMFRYTYNYRDEMIPYQDIDISSLIIY